ncbi:MAG: T9SS type A sorting domain-containing protein [Reichenbachiella sp.]|uniref:T9SS type A sorting domain-containing protein n=1 Tax=Reichenbachiella sp. TaxID=2184521 RepID=UPI00296628A8|nr:T9SS type A sorting domain-containing protein [Reichenbachiella sp.]MDW3210364.1 T9SS type A sorting domain-containing protein [Reichenbachiella sp.]
MKLAVWSVVILMMLSLDTVSFAQLHIRPINRASNSLATSSGARITATRDTVNLPFWDDFSFSKTAADSTLWESNTGAVINGTLGKVAPTVNVASFDGNDLFGNPHNPGGVGSDTVDVLTSQPIDLEAVKPDKRDSVWLSFYWQMEGLGEVPEQRDFLMLQFLDKKGSWNEELTLLGVADNRFDSFMKESIQINHDDYFHSGFQFRFVSVGNSLGPYDAWHIDYVYLNQDRSPINESLVDRAVTEAPTPIFSEYTMIPYDLLFDFPDTIYHEISFDFATLENKVHPVEFEYTLTNYDYPNTDSAAFNATLFYLNDTDDNFSLPANGRNTNFIPALNDSYFLGYDSLFIETELIFSSTTDGYFIKSIDGPEGAEVITYLTDDEYNYRLNDTIRSYFEIHEALAYDDGSAEYAAGLNKNRSQLAIHYNIPIADTITYIDIYFPQLNPSSSGEEILLSVLKDLSGEPSSVLREQTYIIPGGAQLNQFDRFVLDAPVIVSGEFYIGFQQFTNDYIGIGLDNNSLLGTQKIFVNTEDEWEPNNKVEGMIMIRPVFADSDYVVTSVDEPKPEVVIYPNPANEKLTLQGDFDYYELLDLSGKVLVMDRSRELLISNVQNGIYFLKVYKGANAIVRKIIIQH